MDKYEFNLKVDQIRKMVNKGDYGTAKKIADNIDWDRARSNANLLSMVSQVYEKNRDYRKAKDILLMAYERAPIGKRLLFKLTELALKEGSTEEAEDYYREFCDLAGDDPRQHLLRYKILKQKNAPKEQMIHSLESYTAEELDEKWLYELALLYHENGDADHCVSTCDRLTLMFGLGKYVDKAIDLKLKHKPLSKYQMDLVDNREKYEEKLRRVEQSFQEEEEAEEYITEPESSEESGDFEEDAPVEEPEKISEKKESGERENSLKADESANPEKSGDSAYGDEEIALQVQQTEEDLAKKVSQIETGVHEEEDEFGKTRVIGDIRRARAEARKSSRASASSEPEPSVPEKTPEQQYQENGQSDRPSRRAIHLMIEARNPERGLDIAVEALRQVRQFTGIKNPVAKITGSGLNRRGVLASAEKLAGKDLMIEDAGDMNATTIGELEHLMSRDNTGMRIILIDNPQQIEQLEKRHSSLAEWFDFIREEDVVEVPVEPEPYGEEQTAYRAAEDEQTGYDNMPYGAADEGIREEYSMPEVGEQLSYGSAENGMNMAMSAYDVYGNNTYEDNTSASYHGFAGEEAGESAYGEYTDDMREQMPEEEIRENNEVAEPYIYGEEGLVEELRDDRPVRRVVPVRDQAMRAPDDEDSYIEMKTENSDEEMDIDEFAQYACQYATDIDCSITGKSMLALYERIEIMEEDGLRLTRENAEALIEEAADRAEKPSLGKAIKGIFSSKYDKDGLLILKEEHFI